MKRVSRADLALNMRENGMTPTAIAAQFGCTRQNVYALILTAQRNRYDEEQRRNDEIESWARYAAAEKRRRLRIAYAADLLRIAEWFRDGGAAAFDRFTHDGAGF